MVSDTTKTEEVRDRLDQEKTPEYNPEIHNLYKLFTNQYRKQSINYQKWYYVSNKYRRFGDTLTNIELFLGILILVLFGGLISLLIEFGGLTEATVLGVLIVATILSTVVVAFPIMKARRKWLLKAEQYHRYGQIHQKLYYDIQYSIIKNFSNRGIDIREIKKDYRRIVKRKSELNQTSPALDTKMYDELLDNIEVDVGNEMKEFQLIVEAQSEEGYKKPTSTIRNSTTRIENIKDVLSLLTN